MRAAGYRGEESAEIFSSATDLIKRVRRAHRDAQKDRARAARSTAQRADACEETPILSSLLCILRFDHNMLADRRCGRARRGSNTVRRAAATRSAAGAPTTSRVGLADFFIVL
jgi:hypothetical protein